MMTKRWYSFRADRTQPPVCFGPKHHFEEVFTLSFDYGQRHRNELEAASTIAENAGVPLQILKMDLLQQITDNSLTSRDGSGKGKTRRTATQHTG